jgi:hypothetical protein
MAPAAGAGDNGQVRWFSAALLLALAVFGFACDGDDSNGTTTPTDATPVAAAEALNRAERALNDLQSFHFLLSHENGGSPIALGLVMNQAEGDLNKPDQVRASVEAMAAGLNVEVQFITVGQNVWITNPFNGRWQELNTDVAGNTFFDPSTGVGAAIEAVKDPTIGPGEELDGTPTFLIEGLVDAERLVAFAPDAEPGRDVRVKAWVRAQDYAPVRLRLEGPLIAADAENIVRQLDLSAFNEPVEIEPPEIS